MAQIRRRKMPPQGCAAIATASVFVPAGDWDDIAGITGARSNSELRGRTGNFQGQAAVQTATDIRNPDTPAIAIGALIAADGVSDPNGETSIASGTKRYIRPGWLVSLTSGSTLATGTLMGDVEYLYG